jgi:hypothetical protein
LPRGVLLADVALDNRPDIRAFEALVTQAKSGGTVRLGPDAEQALTAMPDQIQGFGLALKLPELTRKPREVLSARTLRFLRDHPIEEPRLDPILINRLLASVPWNWSPRDAFRLRIFRVDRAELLHMSPRLEY